VAARGVDGKPVFALGALHLAASLIDVLARLTMNPSDTDEERYERFVRAYFPPEYSGDDLPRRLCRELRILVCITCRSGSRSR